MSGSSGGTQATTQKQEPWGPQKGYLQRIMGEAQSLYDEPGPDYYPGSTTVPFAPETEQSIAMQGARATMGSPLNQAAKTENLKTLGGDYLRQGNPALDALYQRSARPVVENFTNAVAPSIAGRFLKAGRYNSGAMTDQYGVAADQLGRTLGDLSASIYAPAYEAERSRMQGAVSQAPSLANQDYTDISQLNAAGRAREDLGERQIAENIARYNYGAQQPSNKLRDFLQFVNGNYGGTTTSAQPIYRNPTSGALGGALAGGTMFGPYGAAAGGLLGYFGS
jgi:hypothetical protein